MIKWGCAKYFNYKPRALFFIGKISLFYDFSSSWYREAPVRPITIQYYKLIFKLSAKTDLRCCRVHCASCEIIFFTSPHNKRRTDLNCPFGCQNYQKHLKSNQRSIAYYQTKQGKEKKKSLNKKRTPKIDQISALTENDSKDNSREVVPLIKYLVALISRIECKPISIEQVHNIMRQHSIAIYSKTAKWINGRPKPP